ncbi:unnamed protein product, partial [Prunus brigantina]
MPREKVKNFCQDALIHASLCDYLSGSGIDLYFITENGYTTEGRRVLNTYLKRYKFHQDDNSRALLLAIPSSVCKFRWLKFIKEMLCFPKRKTSNEFIKDMP